MSSDAIEHSLASFPIFLGKPSHQPRACSSECLIAGRDGRGIQASLAHLAATAGRSSRTTAGLQLQQDEMRENLEPLVPSRMLTILLDVLIKHFNPKNAADFGQGLQMVYVDDVWPQRVVQNGAQLLQVNPFEFEALEMPAKSAIEQLTSTLRSLSRRTDRTGDARPGRYAP